MTIAFGVVVVNGCGVSRVVVVDHDDAVIEQLFTLQHSRDGLIEVRAGCAASHRCPQVHFGSPWGGKAEHPPTLLVELDLPVALGEVGYPVVLGSVHYALQLVGVVDSVPIRCYGYFVGRHACDDPPQACPIRFLDGEKAVQYGSWRCVAQYSHGLVGLQLPVQFLERFRWQVFEPDCVTLPHFCPGDHLNLHWLKVGWSASPEP